MIASRHLSGWNALPGTVQHSAIASGASLLRSPARRSTFSRHAAADKLHTTRRADRIPGAWRIHLTYNSTYVDITHMARKPNSSAQTHDLLEAMARHPAEWRYGYELSKQTGLSSGTLYPLLIRLSDQGMLESRWQEPERPGRPPRHAYRLTANGLAFARGIAAPQRRSRVRPRVLGATT